MDNLEDFIKNNKEGFDTKSPSPDVWNRIKDERNEQKIVPIAKGKRASVPMQVMRMAASFLILALAAFGGYKLLESPTTSGDAMVQEAGNTFTNEVAELDQYYEGQVKGQFAKVESLIASDEIIEEIKAELDILDKEKSKLLSDYEKNTNDKEIVEA
ncbi:MAG: hypothetical protein ACPGYY_10025, partial [Bacteroidia bacterium]